MTQRRINIDVPEKIDSTVLDPRKFSKYDLLLNKERSRIQERHEYLRRSISEQKHENNHDLEVDNWNDS